MILFSGWFLFQKRIDPGPPRPLDPAGGGRLLHRDLHLRVVPGGRHPLVPGSGPLAADHPRPRPPPGASVLRFNGRFSLPGTTRDLLGVSVRYPAAQS